VRLTIRENSHGIKKFIERQDTERNEPKVNTDDDESTAVVDHKKRK
jgi:hypothetical protein